jgi:hypothetical protein
MPPTARLRSIDFHSRSVRFTLTIVPSGLNDR